jgi:hypothetical protein
MSSGQLNGLSYEEEGRSDGGKGGGGIVRGDLARGED